MPRLPLTDAAVNPESPRANRVRRGVCGLLALLGVGLLFALLQPEPQVAASADSPVVLSVHANGDVVSDAKVTVTPATSFDGVATDNTTCEASQSESQACRFSYTRNPGLQVTLTAVGDPNRDPPVVFEGWNDIRCPAGRVPTCTLPLLEDEFVMATFSPQEIKVQVNGAAGTVRNQANSGDCANTDTNCGQFPQSGRNLFGFNTIVTLVADGPDPRWQQDRCDALGVTPDKKPTCTVIVNWRRVVSVGFGEDPRLAIPNAFPDATLRIRHTGNGKGTVRTLSTSIRCGSVCMHKGNLGVRETLVADAAAGSRFVSWRGACPNNSTATTCKTALGIGLVEARFDASGSTPPPPTPGPKPGPKPKAFQAYLKGKVKASGHGGARKVSFTVVVNAPARVLGRLKRGGKQIRKQTWDVPKGKRQLTLTVPKKARKGQHRLTLTITGPRGASKTVGGNVRLPR